MKKVIIAVLLSSVMVLSGMLMIAYLPAETSHSPVGSSIRGPTELPASMLRFQAATGIEVQDLSSILPSSYTTTTTLSSLNGIAYGDNEYFVVGGSTNYANSWSPLVGIYNPHTGVFTDLTNQLINDLSASNWYISSEAWNGHIFLFVGINYVSSSFYPTLAAFNPHSGKFTDLSSQIPSVYGNWTLYGITWNGHEFVIVGTEPSSATSTGVKAVMATYRYEGNSEHDNSRDWKGNHGFRDLSDKIPAQYQPDYFLGVTWGGGSYLITGMGTTSYPESDAVLLLYTPSIEHGSSDDHSGAHAAGVWSNLYSLIPSNVFWYDGATWFDNNFFVVGTLYPDFPAVAILNVQSNTLTDLSPGLSISNPGPYPSTWYWLGNAATANGNTLYVVGQSQQTNSNLGSSAIMGTITLLDN